MTTTKTLIIAESERIAELIHELDEAEKEYAARENTNTDRYALYDLESKIFKIKAELKAKMHELRRDTVRFEKEL